MSSGKTTLYETIRDAGVDLQSPDFVAIAGATIQHLLGTFNAYEYQAELKQFSAFDKKTKEDLSAQKFRLRMFDASYMHLDLKFFCLNLVKRGISKNNLAKFKDDFNIDRNDVVLVRKAFEKYGFRASLKKSKLVKAARLDQIDKAAFDRAFDPFVEAYPMLMRHIKSRTYTKLRFVSISSNMEFADFHMELTCKALQAYVRMLPTDKEPAHILNYLRSAVSNHTTNLIKSHTTQKRQRMVQGAADGFGGHSYEIPVVSENQLFRTFGVDNVSYENMQGIDYQADDEKVREGRLSFEMILRKFGKTEKRRKFIQLISLQENPEFSDFLRSREKIRTDQDNIDFSEMVGEKAYFAAVCSFLNVKIKSARRFTQHIARVAYPEHFAAEITNGK